MFVTMTRKFYVTELQILGDELNSRNSFCFAKVVKSAYCGKTIKCDVKLP